MTKDERGQVLAFTLVCMVVLIAMVGFAVDVGRAYLVQRQLQSSVDAAALAGAQELPDPTMVKSVAQQYGPASKNPSTAVDNVTTNVEMKCVKSAPGCSSTFGTFNAVQVTAKSDVKTFFARIIGVDKLTVNATATACSPCSSKPLDIMIVLDRTGSMCDVRQNGCRDLDNAVTGVRTFLGFMDPELDEVGLAVFPPTLSPAANTSCNAPTGGGKNYGYDAHWPSWVPDSRDPRATSGIYAIGSPDFDYLVQKPDGTWDLNGQSHLVQLLGCLQAAGTTSYSNALVEAQHELEIHGRGNVQDVIIFLSDGAANETPHDLPNYLEPYRNKPCSAGIHAASNVKAGGTIVYTIGYDLDSDSNNGRCGNEGLTARSTLEQMASELDNYYDQPVPRQLNTIFTRIAADISRPSSRLIPDNAT